MISCTKDNVLYTLGYLLAQAMFLLLPCSTALRAQAIRIKMVDGKSGRIVAGVCVGVNTPDIREMVFIPAGKGGVAQLRLGSRGEQSNISYEPELGCGGTSVSNPTLRYSDMLRLFTTGDHPSCAFPRTASKARYQGLNFPTAEILQQGSVSANTCGKAAASPQPGEVILFVRPRTLGEQMKDWANRESFPF